MKRIVSWNVNGIRALVKKEGSLKSIFDKLEADVICLQETKITPDLMEDQFRYVEGYESFWSFSKIKKGYSGVATFCKTGFTIDAKEGIEGMDEKEGRVIMTDHQHFIILNVYFPNGGREGRSDFKMKFYISFRDYVKSLKEKYSHKNIVILGDVNTAHTMLDIHNTVEPVNATGFLPSEREWIDKLLKDGYVDSFRYFHKGIPHCYTWWNQRTFARGDNKGWRIDYIFVPDTSVPIIETVEDFSEDTESSKDQSIDESNTTSIDTLIIEDKKLLTESESKENVPDNKEFIFQISSAGIMRGQHGSDHCPIYVDLKNEMKMLPEHPPAKLSSITHKQRQKKKTILNFFGTSNLIKRPKNSETIQKEEPPLKKQKLN